jgi:hypothetical protein
MLLSVKAGLHVTFCLQACMIRYVWQIRHAKHAATLLMLSLSLFLSLSKSTMDEALLTTIISLCVHWDWEKRNTRIAHGGLESGHSRGVWKQSSGSSVFCEVLKPHSVHAKRQICRPHVTFCLIRLAWSCKAEDKTLRVDPPSVLSFVPTWRQWLLLGPTHSAVFPASAGGLPTCHQLQSNFKSADKNTLREWALCEY